MFSSPKHVVYSEKQRGGNRDQTIVYTRLDSVLWRKNVSQRFDQVD